MKDCSQSVCLQFKCNCSQELPQTQTNVHSPNLEYLYSKFSNTLEQELRNQHQRYAAQTEQLKNQIFDMKNTIIKLEIRNKKDHEAEAELRREYNILLQKLNNQETRIVKEVEIVERIKEVPVKADNQELRDELAYWKAKAEECIAQLQKIKAEKEKIEQQNINLRQETIQLKRTLKKLEVSFDELVKTGEEKDQKLDKLNQHINVLKSSKQIVVETKHLFPEFRAPEKVRTETKVETIYVDRPVQKLVFVEVEKKVKEFVQPQRAIVNRILCCSPEKSCKCEDNVENATYTAEVVNLKSCIGQLEDNIAAYKSERSRLVDTIGARDSQLNYLQSKMRLLKHNEIPTRIAPNQTVNVTVSRARNEEAPYLYSPVSSTKNEVNNRKRRY